MTLTSITDIEVGLFMTPIHYNAFKQSFRIFLTHAQINKYSVYAVLVHSGKYSMLLSQLTSSLFG